MSTENQCGGFVVDLELNFLDFSVILFYRDNEPTCDHPLENGRAIWWPDGLANLE
ncbi:hypothetical protein ACJX0J_008966, partial [Zea mays]